MRSVDASLLEALVLFQIVEDCPHIAPFELLTMSARAPKYPEGTARAAFEDEHPLKFEVKAPPRWVLSLTEARPSAHDVLWPKIFFHAPG